MQALLAWLLAAAGAALETPAPRPLRYDLRAGDRLVYRQTLVRESRSARATQTARLTWTNEVLVLAAQAGQAVVGMQRRRTSAELIQASEKGRDTLARERVAFARQIAREPPADLAEANIFDARGQARLDVQARREWPSELLPLVHEIEAVPEAAVEPGSSWSGVGTLGLPFRAEDWEALDGESCLRLRGALPRDQVVLRVWFCPGSGLLRRLRLEGRYPSFQRELRETLELDLLERGRGESPAAWLDAPERRRGALAALLLADGAAVDTARLARLLREDDGGLRRDVLALLIRRRATLAPDVFAPLLRDPSPRVGALALRALDAARTEAARPLIESALGDPRQALREAALAFLRRRLPPGATFDARDLPRVWAQAAETPAADRAPDGDCDAPGWAGRFLRARRFPPEPPGVRLSLLTRGPRRGQPYVVRVPEDYRGDEPLPLLIVFSGGPGRALAGWSTSAAAVSETGWLAAFPQAVGMWWDAPSEDVVESLLEELFQRFNVDPDRVYVTGFSNGGTATLRFAARYGDRVAAAAPLMGAGMFVGDPPPLAGLGRVPLLFVHGESDEVIAVEASRETLAAVRREAPGTRAELRVLAGRGHDVTLADDDGLTLPFLEDKRREPFPRELAFEITDLRAPRRFWLEVVEKEAGTARLEGRIDDDGTVRVKSRRVCRLRLLLQPDLLPRGARELRVLVDGREAWRGPVRHDCALLERTARETGDPFRAHSLELALTVERR
jgi:pimeloyl-ACP methyl ester carboxylesterase